MKKTTGYYFILKVTLGIIIISCLSSCSATTSINKNFLSSYQGLKQESKTSDSTTYNGDIPRLKKYTSVYLETVEIREPKEREKYKVTPEEIKELKVKLKNALVTEIGKTKYKLVTNKDSNTLSIRIAVTNFHPGDPKIFAASYTPYVGLATGAYGLVSGKNLGAGAATLEAEIIDSVTRERFFSLVDRNKGGKLDLKSGMSRYGHIHRAFELWAKRLAAKIEE